MQSLTNVGLNLAPANYYLSSSRVSLIIYKIIIIINTWQGIYEYEGNMGRNEWNLWHSKMWPNVLIVDSIDGTYFCYYWSYFLGSSFGGGGLGITWLDNEIYPRYSSSDTFLQHQSHDLPSLPPTSGMSSHHTIPFLANHIVTFHSW